MGAAIAAPAVAAVGTTGPPCSAAAQDGATAQLAFEQRAIKEELATLREGLSALLHHFNLPSLTLQTPAPPPRTQAGELAC